METRKPRMRYEYMVSLAIAAIIAANSAVNETVDTKVQIRHAV